MLPFISYGCEIWSLTQREEHRLKVFGNRVLRRIPGPKKDEMVRGWRRLYEGELHNLYASPNIDRVIKFKEVHRTCSMHGRDVKCV
jgi:hypothetical protein